MIEKFSKQELFEMCIEKNLYDVKKSWPKQKLIRALNDVLMNERIQAMSYEEKLRKIFELGVWKVLSNSTLEELRKFAKALDVDYEKVQEEIAKYSSPNVLRHVTESIVLRTFVEMKLKAQVDVPPHSDLSLRV